MRAPGLRRRSGIINEKPFTTLQAAFRGKQARQHYLFHRQKRGVLSRTGGFRGEMATTRIARKLSMGSMV